MRILRPAFQLMLCLCLVAATTPWPTSSPPISRGPIDHNVRTARSADGHRGSHTAGSDEGHLVALSTRDEASGKPQLPTHEQEPKFDKRGVNMPYPFHEAIRRYLPAPVPRDAIAELQRKKPFWQNRDLLRLGARLELERRQEERLAPYRTFVEEIWRFWEPDAVWRGYGDLMEQAPTLLDLAARDLLKYFPPGRRHVPTEAEILALRHDWTVEPGQPPGWPRFRFAMRAQWIKKHYPSVLGPPTASRPAKFGLCVKVEALVRFVNGEIITPNRACAPCWWADRMSCRRSYTIEVWLRRGSSTCRGDRSMREINTWIYRLLYTRRPESRVHCHRIGLYLHPCKRSWTSWLDHLSPPAWSLTSAPVFEATATCCGSDCV